MAVLVAGLTLLAAVLGLFYLKDRTSRLWVARLAFSGLVARLTVLGTALTLFGAILAVDGLLFPQ